MTGEKTLLNGQRTMEAWTMHEPIPDGEIIEKAHDRVKASTVMTQSVVANELSRICQLTYSSAIDTMCVTLTPDGFTAQIINPHFVLRAKGPGDIAFVRTHEMYHLVFRHLWGDREMSTDPNYTVAQEVVINDRVQQLVGGSSVPPSQRYMPLFASVDDPTKFEPQGINPWETYTRYRKDLKDQGLEPKEYVEFVASDIACYLELSKMAKPPLSRNQQKNSKCETGAAIAAQGSGGDQGDSQNGNQQPQQADGPAAQVDPSQLRDTVEQAIGNTVDQAMREKESDSANKPALHELGDLMDNEGLSEAASKLWGLTGANALRGDTQDRGNDVAEYWQQFLDNFVASIILEDERLGYNSAIWWDPRIARKRAGEKFNIVVALDTSGSMHPQILSYISTKFGDADELKITYLAFDTEVYPITPGEPLRGGGGTSIHDLEEYLAEEMNGDFDAVICVTDGYFENTLPREDNRDKWFFLLTPDHGGHWLEAGGMPVVEMDPKDLQAESYGDYY